MSLLMASIVFLYFDSFMAIIDAILPFMVAENCARKLKTRAWAKFVEPTVETSEDALLHGAMAACVFAGDRMNPEKSARKLILMAVSKGKNKRCKAF